MFKLVCFCFLFFFLGQVVTDQTRAQQVETPTLKSISSISAPEWRQIWWKSVFGIPSRRDCWKLSKSLGDVLRSFNRSLLSAAEQAAGP